jgi:hypothetical protein
VAWSHCAATKTSRPKPDCPFIHQFIKHKKTDYKNMKNILKFALVLTAVAFVGNATAQTTTTIRISGSSAYRSQTEARIKTFLGAGYLQAHNGTSPTSPNASVYKHTYGSPLDTVIIKTAWTGSAVGVATCAAPGVQTTNFLTTPVNDAAYTSGKTDPTASGAAAQDVASTDVMFSDVSQLSTPYNDTYNLVAYEALTEEKVGVVPFRWVISKANGDFGITNITDQVAQSLMTNGSVSATRLGSSLSGKLVKLVGRNADSGTRVSAFAESGFGALSLPLQWQPRTSGGAQIANADEVIASIVAWPAETLLGVSFGPGESGYNSGGRVARALRAKNDAEPNTNLIGYLGESDASTALLASALPNNIQAQALNYNGVAFEATPYTNIKNGQYSFWSEVRIGWKSSLSGTSLTLAENLRDFMIANAGLKLSDMLVARSFDGGVIN